MTKDPLRIGLLVDSFTQPRWIHHIIADIEASSLAKVVVVIKNNAPGDGVDDRPLTLGQKILAHRQGLLYLLYRKLDDFLFKVTPDAFQRLPIDELLPDCPVIRVTPFKKGFSDYIQAEDIERIKPYQLDVALRFGFRILKGPILQLPKYGVWSYHHGDNRVNRGAPPGFWEVMEGEPVTGSILQILSEELDNGQVIYRSYATTHQHSVKRNKNNYYWKSTAFVLRKLKDLAEYGPAALNGCDPLHSSYYPYSNRLYKQPTNAEMIGLLARWGGRYALKKLEGLFYFQQWFLAYRLGKSAGPDGALFRFKPMVPPRDRFWADPFPVKHGDKYFIFIEEFLYQTGKGYISVIEMDEQGRWTAPVKVLEKDHHLSYPFIFEWQNNYYMIPETSGNKTIELYRCVSFPSEWELQEVLMSKVNAVDTTLAEINDRWWMFTNIAVDGARRDDELHLFYADTPFGPWRPHRRNPVKSDVRSARPGGRLFPWNGQLYRPAQDCSKGYGYANSLNRITRLDPDHYDETEVSKVLPHWQKNLTATHTFNHAHNLTVVDGLMKRKRFF